MKFLTPYEQMQLMNNLYRVYGSQKAVADALNVSQQVFNYWLHVAKKPPYEKLLEMQKLWEKTQAKYDETFSKGHQDNLALLSDKAGNIKNYTQCSSGKGSGESAKSLLDIDAIYYNQTLKSAEDRLHLSLRTIFAVILLHCCDEKGEFKLNPNELKKEILPYIDIDFSTVMNKLCDLGLIEPFFYQEESYGFIALEKYMRSEIFSEAREQRNQRLNILHDAQLAKSRRPQQYH
jgi:hypothetical protein